MGKTIVYLLVGLEGFPEYVVVLCPTRAMAAQRREILRHFPFYASRYVFVRGNSTQRHKLWRTPNARVFITTPATFQSDTGGRILDRDSPSEKSNVIAPSWALSSSLDTLILDEFHKVIRRRQSGTFKQLKQLSPERLILSSGSAASKGPQDVWPALNLCDRKRWSSFWNYVNTFCDVEEMPWGAKEIGPCINIEAWRQGVAPYIFHRKKRLGDYPPKTRETKYFELEPWQRKLHDDLRNDLMTETSSDFIIAQNSLDALFKARLALICPKALSPSLGYGAGLEGIVEDAQDSELTHFAISTPFRAPIPYIEEYLRAQGYNTWVLSGHRGIGPDEQDAIIKAHADRGGVIIQTIKYATSYEFLGFEHNYFLGYEFDPEDNKQCEDRWSRQSSTLPCYHWYIAFDGTYDEELIDNMVYHSGNVRRLMDEGKYWHKNWLEASEDEDDL